MPGHSFCESFQNYSTGILLSIHVINQSLSNILVMGTLCAEYAR